MLPFTRDQFLATFVAYNTDVWPLPIVAALLGALMVAAVLRPSPTGDRAIAAGLALLWIWTGVVYLGGYFAAINPVARAFAALFVVQGLALLLLGVIRGRLTFAARSGRGASLGWALIAYVGLVYPLVGLWLGHRSDELPVFGVTPCPLTLYTAGLLLVARSPGPRWLLAVPLVWSLIGTSAAFLLGVPPDLPLIAAGAGLLTRWPREPERTAA